MVMVLSYGMHVSVYMIFLFSMSCMNYGYGWFVLFSSFVWHVLFYVYAFLFHFEWKNACFYVMNNSFFNSLGHGLLTSCWASNK
jgi:hypothetical protein